MYKYLITVCCFAFRSARRVRCVGGCSSKTCWCRRCRGSPSTLCCWTTSSSTPTVSAANLEIPQEDSSKTHASIFFLCSLVGRPPCAAAGSDLLPEDSAERQREREGERAAAAPQPVPAQAGPRASVQGQHLSVKVVRVKSTDDQNWLLFSVHRIWTSPQRG